MDFLAVYDIREPKRLRRVARVMEGFGIRVQKSVFECNLSRAGLRALLRRMETEIDLDEDSVRIYPLLDNSRHKQTIVGRGEVTAWQPCLAV